MTGLAEVQQTKMEKRQMKQSTEQAGSRSMGRGGRKTKEEVRGTW